MEFFRILTAINALAAIALISMGVVSIRHRLRRSILHGRNGHV